MDIPNIIAVVAAAIALLGALIAWWQTRRGAALYTYNRSAVLILKMDRVFINEPQLRPYFLEGKKRIPTGQEQKAKAVAAMMLNIFEAVLAQREAMGKEERKAWKDYMSAQIRSVELLQEVYKEQPAWYPNLKRSLNGQ